MEDGKQLVQEAVEHCPHVSIHRIPGWIRLCFVLVRGKIGHFVRRIVTNACPTRVLRANKPSDDAKSRQGAIPRPATLTMPLVMRIFWQATAWNAASSLGSRISPGQRLPFAFTAY